MLILLKGKLDTLNLFIDGMACGREEQEDVYVLDTTVDEYFDELEKLHPLINEDTHVITFNNVGICTNVNGKNYWDTKNVKLHNFYVDHPLYFKKEMEVKIDCMEIIVIDREHARLLNKLYPNKKVRFIPHGGIEYIPDRKRLKDRDIDVLYIGSLWLRDDFDNLPLLYDEEIRDIIVLAKDLLVKYPYISMEQLADLLIQELGIEKSNDMVMYFMELFLSHFRFYIRGYYQIKVVEALAQNGIHVSVYGYKWDCYENRYPDFIEVHDSISAKECFNKIAESKIVLNTQPWYKDGSHERVYNAMLNGAVAVTECTSYFRETIMDRQEAIFFELNQLDDMVNNVKYLLNNLDFAQEIADNGYRKAKEFTWTERLEMILN